MIFTVVAWTAIRRCIGNPFAATWQPCRSDHGAKMAGRTFLDVTSCVLLLIGACVCLFIRVSILWRVTTRLMNGFSLQHWRIQAQLETPVRSTTAAMRAAHISRASLGPKQNSWIDLRQINITFVSGTAHEFAKLAEQNRVTLLRSL